MELLTVLLVLVSTFYIFIILLFFLGLGKTYRPGRTDTDPGVTATVIIPFRNEENALTGLLLSLAGQEGSAGVQYILADDHSTDRSSDIARDFCAKDKRFIYLAPHEGITGKKSVLKHAVLHAETDWIIQLDADISIGNGFIKAHLGMRSALQPDFVSAPVAIAPVNNIASGMEALEFMSLNASGAGSFGIGSPVMCNGANMAYSRSVWLEAVGGEGAGQGPSGDDMFLLHYFKKTGRSMRFLSSSQALASVKPASGPGSLLAQRLRWSSKSRYFKDPSTVFTALVVYLNSLIFLFALSFSLGGKLSYIFPLTAYLAKAVTDILLLSRYAAMTRQTGLFKYFLPLSVIHYFYIVFLPILAFFLPFTWKGRKY